MLGKAFNQVKVGFSGGLSSLQSVKHYDVMESKVVDGSDELPFAPKSAFRKRPVKLVYDKNEFPMFRLPSENAFLLEGFDKEDIFGRRKGIQQSPHIKAQTDLDSNLLWLLAGGSILMLMCEMKPKAEFRALRTNYLNSDTGKFEEADFV